MGFKQLREEFEQECPKDLSKAPEVNFQYWYLRLLFEIAGNLDSLVVTSRASEKHIDRMATAYSELIQLQKDRAQK